MNAVADTSWLYAFFVASDAHHEKAVAQSGSIESLHVPPAILVETLDLMRLRKGLGRASAENALGQMEADPHFRLAEPPHDHAAAAKVYRGNRRLSYADAAAVAAARRVGGELCTFDKRQRAALGAATNGTP